jgi:hypothetical protein
LRPQKKPKPDNGKAKYELSARDKTVLAKLAAAMGAPRIKVIDGENAPTLKPDHPNELVGYGLLMEALGAVSFDFLNGLLFQLTNAAQSNEVALNFMLSVVQGAKSKDQLETMLLAQMAVINMAIMGFAGQLRKVETIQQQDSAERALNKLARTYAMQLEALKRYRTGGEQKVTVQHVSVSEGGQAIVGNVTQETGGTAPQKPVTTTPALTDARQQAMPIIEPPAQALALRIKKKDGGRDDEQSSA